MRLENRKQAVVIGGSMGGLVAARVLSNHFERVTLLDRDRFPAAGEQRRGVPQGRHTHGLLASGAAVLEDLFPGLRNELVEAGAVSGDVVLKGRWFHEGGNLKQVPSGLDGLLLSRPLLEGMVRKRLFESGYVEVLEETEVQGLDATPGRQRVTGVRLKDGRVIAADLVVNCCGRGSHGPEWLESLATRSRPSNG